MPDYIHLSFETADVFILLDLIESSIKKSIEEKKVHPYAHHIAKLYEYFNDEVKKQLSEDQIYRINELMKADRERNL